MISILNIEEMLLTFCRFTKYLVNDHECIIFCRKTNNLRGTLEWNAVDLFLGSKIEYGCLRLGADSQHVGECYLFACWCFYRVYLLVYDAFRSFDYKSGYGIFSFTNPLLNYQCYLFLKCDIIIFKSVRNICNIISSSYDSYRFVA